MENTLRETLHKPSSSNQPHHSSLIRFMYVGHFLARWGARMWEFSVALYMINIWPDSLLFTATYGVVESASTALFGPIIGRLVDKMTYTQVLRLWLLTQNLSFVMAGAAVTTLLVSSSLLSSNFTVFILLVVLTNVCGAVGVLSTLAGTILIEREWVVVISEGEPPEVLTKMNSTIRRIDLTCKLLAPVFTGFIISFVSLRASAVIFAGWSTVAVWVEYWLLTSVYNGIPALGERDHRRSSYIRRTNDILNSVEDIEETPEEGGDPKLSTSDWKRRMKEHLSKLPFVDAWIVYSKQEVVLPGVALSLLFFTVLSFGSLMTATLEWKGIPAYIISIARGVSAMIGIAATILYPILHSYISSLRTGLWSIWAQWCCLSICVLSVFVHSGISSAWMLVGGVAASRLGLWMFDLAVMQQMQDLVPESDRCIVAGAQNSLQSMLDLLTYIMGIIVSNPEDFGQLVILSFVVASLASLLYTFHVYRVRKHLFHFEKVFPMMPNWRHSAL